MSDRTEIRSLTARRVWNSRGLPTLEVELYLAGGRSGRGIAPSGASTGSHELPEQRDADPRLGGHDVAGAIDAVNRHLEPALRGLDAADQPLVDARLVALREQHPEIGGNVTIATSLACLDAAARAADQPAWRLLAGVGDCRTLPRPQIQLIGGGAHAAGHLDLQDLMVVPLGDIGIDEALVQVAEVQLALRRLLIDDHLFSGYADEGGFWPRFHANAQALEYLTRAIERAGLAPGTDMAISVDVAASQLHGENGYYLRLEDTVLGREDWMERLATLVDAWPIVLIEDPLHEDDLEGTASLRRALPGRCRIVGDDLVATDAQRISACAEAIDAVLIKPNQVGTLSGARDAFTAALAADLTTIASARSGETEDVSIVDLAVGWQTGMLKVGALARGERTAKWNHLLRISEALGHPPLAPMT